MGKIKVAVVGYGNVGSCAVEAVLQEPDMELTGVVELADLGKRKSTNGKCSRLPDVKFAKDISEIKDVDVAIVSCPSRSVKATVSRILQMGINTVDSFDVHPEI